VQLMANDMKMRARLMGDVAEIKILMSHPMETGRRKNSLDETIPAHFIQLVTVTLNDKPVLEAQWGTGISKNPYLTFHVKGASVGDRVVVTWHDNQGLSSTHKGQVV
jgi:sulfur-oxidizing protein SoxZ